MRATLALLPLAAALSGCISVTANDVSSTPPRATPGAFGEASLINASGARIGLVSPQVNQTNQGTIQ